MSRHLSIFQWSDLESIKTGGTELVPALLKSYWEEMPRLIVASFLIGFLILIDFYLWAGGSLLLAALVLVGVIAPIWAGFLYMIGKGVLHFRSHLVDLFRAAFHYYLRTVLIVLPVFFFAAIYATSVTLLSSFSSPPMAVIAGIVTQLIVLSFFVMITLYSLPLMALFDLSVRQGLKKSLALILRWPLRAVCLMSSVFLLASVADLFSPLGWLLYALVLGPLVVYWTLAQARAALKVEAKI